jgi:hypothetical protein
VEEGQIDVDGHTQGDVRTEASIAYDETGLHLSFDVEDDHHTAIAGQEMWKGDSVQTAFSNGGVYGPEVGFAMVDGEPVIEIWHAPDEFTPDSSAFSLDADRRDGQTRYEAVLPWSEILTEPPSSGDEVRFSFITNDNDGNGREGYIEWLPVIGDTKDPTQLGTLSLVPEGRSWTAWLDGPREMMVGDATTFALRILNDSDSKRAVSTEATENDVVIPPRSIATVPIEPTFETAGEQQFSTTVMGGNREQTVDRSVKVLPSTEEISGRFDALESDLPKLEERFSEAESAGHGVEYERVVLKTVEEFIEYGRLDIENENLERARYVADELRDMYEEAISSLNNYLDEEQQGTPVPRFQMSDVSIDGMSFTGDKTVPSTGERLEDEPVFFHGYWPFSNINEKIRDFPEYGANIVHLPIRPWETIFKPPSAGLQGWTKWADEAGSIAYDRDDSTAHSGSGSMLMTAPENDGLGIVSQRIPATPETTYVCEAYFKGTDVGEAFFRTGWQEFGGEQWHFGTKLPGGTFDWQKVTFELTTAQGQSEFVPRFSLKGQTGKLWVDDVVVRQKGAEENLVTGGSFDGGEESTDNEKGFVVRTDDIERRIEQELAVCRKNDVTVNYILQPHAMPGWVLEKWPGMKTDAGHFIPFKFHHPKAREIIEAHYRAALNLIAGREEVQSIVLSNEPGYNETDSERTKRGWQSHLQSEYESIDALNSVYRETYSSFAAVPIPDAENLSPTPRAYDWFQFKTQRFAEWHRWLDSIAEDVAPEEPTHVKMMGKLFETYVDEMENPPDWRVATNDYLYESGINPELFAEFTEINGFDDHNYLNERGRLHEDDFSMLQYYDLHQSLQTAPAFNSESHFIENQNQNYVPEMPPHLETCLWQGAIHGCNASAMWVWERESQTPLRQAVVKGSILHRPDGVVAMGQTALDLNRLMPEVTAFQEAGFDVRILYSMPAYIYTEDYHDSVNALYRAISTAGQKTGFITESQLIERAFGDADAIVVPHATHVDPAILGPLADFGAENTVLIVGTDSLRNDPKDRPISGDGSSNVHSTATTVETPLDDGLRGRVVEVLESAGIKQISVNTTDEGDPRALEWRTAEHDGQTLLNVVNYDTEPVDVRVDGLAATGTDLRDGQDVDLGALSLEPNIPRLIAIGN